MAGVNSLEERPVAATTTDGAVFRGLETGFDSFVKARSLRQVKRFTDRTRLFGAIETAILPHAGR